MAEIVKARFPLDFPLAFISFLWEFLAFIGTIRPSDCLRYFCLPPFVVRHTTNYACSWIPQALPSWLRHRCTTWIGLRHRHGRFSSPYRLPCIAFRKHYNVGPWFCTRFGAQYYPRSLTSHALRLMSPSSAQGLLPVVWLSPYRTGFPPAWCRALL